MEMLRKLSGEKYVDHLPCAGITLFRFYGYYLSRLRNQHPEESDKTVNGSKYNTI